MAQFAIRLLTLAASAAVALTVPAVVPAEAGSGSHHHIKKHKHWRHAARSGWYPGEMQPAVRTTEPICPGIGRSFECKIWPPPYADDPDRKTFRH